MCLLASHGFGLTSQLVQLLPTRPGCQPLCQNAGSLIVITEISSKPERFRSRKGARPSRSLLSSSRRWLFATRMPNQTLNCTGLPEGRRDAEPRALSLPIPNCIVLLSAAPSLDSRAAPSVAGETYACVLAQWFSGAAWAPAPRGSLRSRRRGAFDPRDIFCIDPRTIRRG